MCRILFTTLVYPLGQSSWFFAPSFGVAGIFRFLLFIQWELSIPLSINTIYQDGKSYSTFRAAFSPSQPEETYAMVTANRFWSQVVGFDALGFGQQLRRLLRRSVPVIIPAFVRSYVYTWVFWIYVLEQLSHSFSGIKFFWFNSGTIVSSYSILGSSEGSIWYWFGHFIWATGFMF